MVVNRPEVLLHPLGVALNRYEVSMIAAVLTKFNEPLEIRDIFWNRQEYGQVFVKVLVTGICGAQLSEIRGEKNPDAPLPRLLGHEACVEVLEVGKGVKTVKPGDRCIAHWRKGDGVESDFPVWYSEGFPSHYTSGLITTFSTHSVLSENRLTAVPNDTPPELCALLGCGLSTALGTIENEADVKFGERVLIIGCGGLGLNLILAAKLRQASEIWACDIYEAKAETAKGMGATGFIDCRTAVIDQNFNEGQFDVVIDTSGNSQIIELGIKSMASSGRLVMVGQPKPRTGITIENARHMFDGDGKSITATQGGGFSPALDIPRYVAMWCAGRLNLEGLVSHRLPLSRINEGLDLVRNGQAGRVMISCEEQ